jgi:hypothetical protein
MTLRRMLAASLVLLSITAVNLAAEPSPDVQEAANRLASSIYTGPSMTTLRELSDGFGGRLTGSPAYTRSVGLPTGNCSAHYHALSIFSHSAGHPRRHPVELKATPSSSTLFLPTPSRRTPTK